MRTIKLTLAYDGTAFAGWQSQSDRRTLQETLEETLRQIIGERLRVAASGRTDAGVHALGQVVSFDTESALSADVLQRALNAELPRDMAVVEVVDAPPGFHARRDARSKRYRYVIRDGRRPNVFERNYAWHVPQRLDERRLAQAACAMTGTHDFSSFETQGSPRASSVRTVHALEVIRDGVDPDRLLIEIEANGFLYNMVRSIVGTLVEVGRGVRDENWPGEVLAAADRRAAGRTAPPQGLFLLWVKYDPLDRAGEQESR
ncbi:MAG TPA: tRNA pseudouridine(38-40) synthase TruA [Pirellulales bacterium]|jgi:tRNA pseudouridine38-40 synthase|nr:tRNA pseudouridine(38-40) synthase TruA [Pirellulales bacterium]